jgi:hypothetical protein
VSDAAHHDLAAAGLERRQDAGAPLDHAAGREVRAGHVLDEVVVGELRIGDHRERAVDHLGEVVRRDVGRHADRDARGAVDQEVRHLGRQDRGLELLVVVIRSPVDRFLVDVREQLARELAHPALGVAHRRRRIAVDRAEVALAVDQRVAHREVLRHPNEGVVDRRVAVRVILADDIADDARALEVRPVERVVEPALREQDAAVDRLEPVARVGQGPRHDHAHGVVHERVPHLGLDRDRRDVGRRRRGLGHLGRSV